MKKANDGMDLPSHIRDVRSNFWFLLYGYDRYQQHVYACSNKVALPTKILNIRYPKVNPLI